MTTHSSNNVPPPPKRFIIVFRIFALWGLVNVVTTIIFILASLKSWIDPITMLEDIPFLFYGAYGALGISFVLLLFYLGLFMGIYRLRRWTLPMIAILLIAHVTSIVSIVSALSNKSLQFSPTVLFPIVWLVIGISFGVCALVSRRYFIGSYRNLTLQIPFFFLMIPLVIAGALGVLFPDLQENNDSDLIQTSFYTPSKDQNSYYLLYEISRQIYEPTGEAKERYNDFLEGRAWDQAEVDSILKNNKDVLTKARVAATLPYYQCPSYAGRLISITDSPCLHAPLRAIARIASLSALSQARNNDWQGALDDVYIPLRIGQLMIDESSTNLVDYLIGEGMKRTGLNTLKNILTRYRIPSEALSSRIFELETFLENERGLKNALRTEYATGKTIIARLTDKHASSFYMQPNKFFADMADDTRQKIAITDTSCGELEPVLIEYKKMFEKNKPEVVLWKLPFTRNAVLEIIKSVSLTDVSSIQNKRCEADALVEQIRLLMVK